MSWEILERERKSSPSLSETKGEQTESEKARKIRVKKKTEINSGGTTGKEEKEDSGLE